MGKLIIGGALMIGIGLGFLFDQVPAGTLLGLGVGMLVEGSLKYSKKRS
ncbi:hypothetical protein ACJROX_09580 [Pseudalkalibacillus sp. A8]